MMKGALCFKVANKKNVFVVHVFECILIVTCRVQREAHSFQPQMKLEAVDKRSPGLIRVATVEEVDTHRIKVFSLLPSSLFLFTNRGVNTQNTSASLPNFYHVSVFPPGSL